ncbi:MAG TPA: hypothetical protein VGD79_10785 [Thermoanaerobaculia bacterium]|jgi:hypothetical protein
MSVSVGYVSAGKLHLKYDGAAPRLVESKFAHEVRERLMRVAQRNAWKTQGSGAQFMYGRLMNSRMLWGQDAEDEEGIVMSVRSLTRGTESGHILFALGGQGVNGLFSFDPETLSETRLVHGVDHQYEDLALDRRHQLVACSTPKRDGSSSIAVMNPDATDYSELTEGDSLDFNPNWVQGERREIVYSSSGIARDGEGAPRGFAPTVIHRLDVDTAQLDVVAEEKGADLIRPTMTADGTLYYIRRPHIGAEKPSFWRANLDFLLFPVRLLFALMHFLNFFTTRYSGKQLTTAGNTRQRGADVKQMMMWDNLIRARDKAKEQDADPEALVPSAWCLVRQRGVKTEVLAKGVGAYDVSADGSIVYTNGGAIYQVSPEGTRTKVCDGQYISHVIAI